MSKLESQVVNGKVVDIHGSWRNSGRKLQPGIPTLVVYWRSAQSRVQAYSLTGTDRAAYSRTAPNSLSLESLGPSLPLSPFSPCLPGMLRICGGVPHCYSCVGSSESIHTLSQVHVLRGTLLLLMFIRWATGRCKTSTAMLSQVTSWYIIISCLLRDVRATTLPSGTRKIELSCPCRWYAQRVRPSARL